MSEQPLAPRAESARRMADRTRLTRITAAAVLVPAVPLLLLSILALAAFYASPARFDRILTQLPGEELIRSLLVFAPATLLGIVILAVLYALERPAVAAPTKPVPARGPTAGRQLRGLAAGLLLPSGLLLLVSIALRIFDFVAPERWAALLAPLPGDRLLIPVIRLSPWILLGVTVILALLAWRRTGPEEVIQGAGAERKVARLGATATLFAAVPLLGLALTALGLFAASPARFDALIARLTQATFIRLGLVFTPAALLSLVLLATLVLFFSRFARSGGEAAQPAPSQVPSVSRQTLAVWVLTAGLALSAMIGLGLGGVAVYLVLR
jgi:hypothetical protein